MWSQSSSKRAGRAARTSVAGRPALSALALALLLGGCRSAPKPEPVKPAPVAAATATSSATRPGAGTPATATAAPAMTAPATLGAPAAAAAPPPVPPAAASDFSRAVRYMRAGNAIEAELGFKQIALEYPQFAAPLVNLGILYRKSNRLEESEQALKSAVAQAFERCRLERARRHPEDARGVQGGGGLL